jgi:hypothetical protein
MIEHSGHRRAERLPVPLPFRGPGLRTGAVQLLDLSPAGARIEHGEPLRDWSSHPLELPRALGGGRIRAEVVWSRAAERKEGSEGKRWLAYQSGLAFPHSTPAEQAALTVAMVRLAGEWALGLLRDLRRQAKGAPAQQQPFDALCAETLGWLGREIEALRFGTLPLPSSAEPGRLPRRVLIHGPAGEPLWAQLYVQPVGVAWAAMIVTEGESPPAAGTMKGLVFFAETAEEAERLARRHLGEGGAQN